MPELPELEIYRERLAEALGGAKVQGADLYDPFVLRTVQPALADLVGRKLEFVERRSKYLLLGFSLPAVVACHMMLAGRLHLRDVDNFRVHKRRTVATLTFDNGYVLEMTEAGTKRRASLHVLNSRDELDKIDRGVEPFDASLTPELLGECLRRENRQLKTALTAPRFLSGIGNAYSDEILFHARLSPIRLTSRLEPAELERLLHSIREVLDDWTQRVRDACPEGLPVDQKKWRQHMAVHGKFGEPCPECGGSIARISRKSSETNYCPECQTEGKELADRRLSRLGIRKPPPRPREGP